MLYIFVIKCSYVYISNKNNIINKKIRRTVSMILYTEWQSILTYLPRDQLMENNEMSKAFVNLAKLLAGARRFYR